MESKLEIRDVVIDPLQLSGSPLSEVSLVLEPAIEADFMVFSKVKEIKFKADKKRKQVLTGPWLIPDKLLLRQNQDTGEYYNLRFSAEVIEQLAHLYFKNGNRFSFNLNHESDKKVEGYVLESWFVTDESQDKASALGFENLPVGTWMASVKIEDEKIFNEFIETGKVKGFSIEAMLCEQVVKNSMIEEEIGLSIDDFEFEGEEDINEEEWDEVCQHGIQREEFAKKSDNGLQRFYKYQGPNDSKTRDLCKKLMGKVYNSKDIKNLSSKYGQDITQKIGVRTNCRHKFISTYARKKGDIPTSLSIQQQIALELKNLINALEK